jgi:dynactin 4
LGKTEENLPEYIEFDRLKDHLEPFIKQGQQQQASLQAQKDSTNSNSTTHLQPPTPQIHQSPIQTAASAALANSSHSLSKDRYPSLLKRSIGPGMGGDGKVGQVTANLLSWKEDLEPYVAFFPVNSERSWNRGSGNDGCVSEVQDANLEWMRGLESLEERATMEQEWSEGWWNEGKSK